MSGQPATQSAKTCTNNADDGWWRHQPWRSEPKPHAALIK